MKPLSDVSERLAALRSFAQRFTFAALVVGSLILMVLSRADTGSIGRSREVVADALAPVLELLARPTVAVSNMVATFHDIAALRDDNEQLKQENRRLLHWQTVAEQLQRENQALRSQLNSVPDPQASYVSARVIGDTGGAFLRSVLIGAGAQDGLRRGLPVIAGEALVGRITDVGTRSARVLLLTDINSHIPVMLQSNGSKAVLSGDNSDLPRLDFLAPNAGATPGQPVVTSGDGGVFPPGLPIGMITTGQDGVPRVELYMQRADLDYVTAVDYGLPGMLPDDPDSSRDDDTGQTP